MIRNPFLILIFLGISLQAVPCATETTCPGKSRAGLFSEFNLRIDLDGGPVPDLTLVSGNQKKIGTYCLPNNPPVSLKPENTHIMPERKNKKKHRSRAFIESLTFMSISAALYWWRWGLWAEDWQYSFTWEEQRRRYFTLEATKFDSNSFMTNFSHGPNGAIFYNFARTNHLSIAESYLYALTTSLFWEYVVEFKEIVSLNDNIFNTFAGFSIGEPLYQLGTYLSGRRDRACRILSVLVNPILAINNWLDGKSKKGHEDQKDNYLHQGSIFFGSINGNYSGEKPSFALFHLGIESQLISIPDFFKPGQSTIRLRETFLSRIYADMMIGADTIEEFTIESSATVVGLFKKYLTEKSGDAADLSGHQYYLALASGFELFRKRSPAPYDTLTSGSSHSEHIEVTRPTEFSDKMAIINVAGPVFQYWKRAGKIHMQFNFQSYIDFALVNSFALEEFSRDNPLYGTKSTLAKYGYYYAYGLTLASELSLALDNMSFTGKIKYHTFGSIEGLDRFQDSLKDDFHLQDTRSIWQISWAYRIPDTPIAIMLSCQQIHRKGTIKEIFHSETENRIYFQVKMLLF